MLSAVHKVGTYCSEASSRYGRGGHVTRSRGGAEWWLMRGYHRDAAARGAV